MYEQHAKLLITKYVAQTVITFLRKSERKLSGIVKINSNKSYLRRNCLRPVACLLTRRCNVKRDVQLCLQYRLLVRQHGKQKTYRASQNRHIFLCIVISK